MEEDKLPRKFQAKGKQFEVQVHGSTVRNGNDRQNGDRQQDEKEQDTETQPLDEDIPKATYQWVSRFGFPRTLIIDTIRSIQSNGSCGEANKFVVLAALYRKLVESIGGDQVKTSLVLPKCTEQGAFDDLLTVKIVITP